MTPSTDTVAGGGSDDGRGDRLRRRIAEEAARGVARGGDVRRATFQAARRVAGGWVPPDRLPGAAEVCGEVQRDLDAAAALRHLVGDRFDAIAAVVSMLEAVRWRAAMGRAGSDALEHTLLMFGLVHRERPYDEELLTAALVHDVGMAIDRQDPTTATLAALGDLLTPRTRWLIESLPAATAYGDRTLGHRARQRLEAHPDFLDVLLLAEAKHKARVGGHGAPTLEEAVEILRGLDADGEPAD